MSEVIERESFCPRLKFRDFWGVFRHPSIEDWYAVRFGSKLAKDLFSVLPYINLTGSARHVDLGCVWEVCDYFRLPLPDAAKPEGIRKSLKASFLCGWRECGRLLWRLFQRTNTLRHATSSSGGV